MICPDCGLAMTEITSGWFCSCGVTEHIPSQNTMVWSAVSDYSVPFSYNELPKTEIEEFIDYLRGIEPNEKYGYTPKIIVELFDDFKDKSGENSNE